MGYIKKKLNNRKLSPTEKQKKARKRSLRSDCFGFFQAVDLLLVAIIILLIPVFFFFAISVMEKSKLTLKEVFLGNDQEEELGMNVPDKLSLNSAERVTVLAEQDSSINSEQATTSPAQQNCTICKLEIPRQSIEDHHIAKGAIEDQHIAKGAVETDEIRKKTIQSSNIATGEVNSRIIKNHSIRSEDLNKTLSFDTLSLTTLSLGTNSISDQNFFGNWDFNQSILSNIDQLTATTGSITNFDSDIILLNPSPAPATTGNRLYNISSSLYWNGSLIGGASTGNWATDGTHVWRETGNVGVGTTSPDALLTIGTNNMSPWVNEAKIFVRMDVDNYTSDHDLGLINTQMNYSSVTAGGAAENLSGIINDVEVSSSSTETMTSRLSGTLNYIYYDANVDATEMIWGTRNVIDFTSTTATNTIDDVRGMHSRIDLQGGAGVTLTNAYGAFTSLIANGGSIDNYYMFKGGITGSTTSITNLYGLYLDDLIGTNSWGIYQTGADDNNYFAGSVGIGTTAPGVAFNVAGKFIVDDSDIYSGTGTATEGAPRIFLGTNTSSDDDSAMLIGRNLVGDSLFSHAIRDESIFSSTSDSAYSSFDSNPTLIGARDPYNHFTAFQARPSYNGTGSINHMAGFTSFLYGTGHIAAGVGLEIYDPGTTGTLDYFYGIYINPITKGTNRYAIYSASAVVPSYHGGFWQTGSDITAAGALRGSNFYTNNSTNSIFIGNGVSQDGYYVTSIGHNSGTSLVAEAQHNVFLGTRAGYAVTDGDRNVLIGSYIGDSLTTGSDNIIIGYNIDAPAVDTTNFLNIGDVIFGDLNSGNVGIGTTAPGAGLQVGSGTAGHSPGSNGIYVVGRSEFDDYVYFDYPIAAGNDIRLTNDDRMIQFGDGLDYSIGYSAVGDSLQFIDGDTINTNVRMIIDSSGNVGIGTTVSGAKLGIKGASGYSFLIEPNSSTEIVFSGSATANINHNTSGQNFYISANAANLYLGASASNARDVTINSSGNVGIGTTSPQTILHIHEDNTSALRFTNANTGSSSTDGTNIGLVYQSLDFLIQNRENGGIRFYTNNNRRMTILNIGNVGIGTTAPSQLFQVNSSATASFVVTSAGQVGIGTTAPNEKLDVAGNARFQSVASGTYNAPLNITSDGTLTTATSDRRFKTNIQDITSPIEKILSLKGVYFNWKENPPSFAEATEGRPNPPSGNGEERRRMMGMIAQDTKEIVPELVFQNPTDGYYGINYGETTALLIEGVKEQQTTIEQMDSRLRGNDMRIDGNEELVTDYESLDADLTELTQTVGEINSSVTLITDILTGHEERLQALESGIGNPEIETPGLIHELTPELIILAAHLSATELEEGYLFTVDGDLKVRDFDVETIVAGEVTIKNEGEGATIGEAIIEEGENEIAIDSNKITGRSKIFVSFESNPEAFSWTEKIESETEDDFRGFKILLSEPAKSDLKVSWWVIDEK